MGETAGGPPPRIAMTSDIGFGYCWCHAGRDLAVGATRLDGLCDYCRNHSPATCQQAHAKTAAENGIALQETT